MQKGANSNDIHNRSVQAEIFPCQKDYIEANKTLQGAREVEEILKLESPMDYIPSVRPSFADV